MNKTAKIFLSAIALYVLGVISCLCFYIPKQTPFVSPVKEISKTISNQKEQSEKQVQYLIKEKQTLHKQLLRTKQEIIKQNEKVNRLETSVSFLSEQVMQHAETSNTDTNCITLGHYVDSLVFAYKIKDSVVQVNQLYTDSLLCNQDSIIVVLHQDNTFLNSELNTLLNNQEQLQQQLKKYQRKIAIKTNNNRILSTSLLAVTSVLAYVKIKSTN